MKRIDAIAKKNQTSEFTRLEDLTKTNVAKVKIRVQVAMNQQHQTKTKTKTNQTKKTKNKNQNRITNPTTDLSEREHHLVNQDEPKTIRTIQRKRVTAVIVASRSVGRVTASHTKQQNEHVNHPAEKVLIISKCICHYQVCALSFVFAHM